MDFLLLLDIRDLLSGMSEVRTYPEQALFSILDMCTSLVVYMLHYSASVLIV